MTADADNPRRRPKGDKRERTRTALLDAALAVTREKGFEFSLQDVAARAGMTTGAIYGNFRNRDDLLMALAERQWGTIRPVFVPGSSFAGKMAAVAEAVIASIPEREPAAVGALTFRAYALTHEEIRRRFHDGMAAGFETGAAWLATQLEEGEAPMPLDQLVRVINALIEGVLFQRFLTPDLMPDDTIRAAFAALAGGRPG